MSTATQETPYKHQVRDPAKVLQTAAAEGLQALWLADTDGDWIPARFLTEELGVWLLLPETHAPTLVPPTRAMLTFRLHDRGYAFLARVKEVHPSTSGWVKVRLAAPDEVMVEDSRRAFRVPVAPGDLHSTVRLGRDKFSATLEDISLLGASLDCPASLSRRLELDQWVHMTLSFDNRAVTVRARVRRITETPTGYSIGVFFADHFRRGEVIAPASIRGLVGLLERRWLRQRLRH